MKFVSDTPLQMSEEQILATIYDFSERPPRLPEQCPKRIEYAIVQEDEGFVASCLNLDIASQGDTPEQAEVMLREAIAAYYEERSEWAKHLACRHPLVKSGSLLVDA